MKAFRYERASGIAAACASAVQPTAKFIAGGTNLVFRFREGMLNGFYFSITNGLWRWQEKVCRPSRI